MSLINITRQFATEDACLDYLERMRWPNGVCCIECGSLKVERLKLNVRPTGKATGRNAKRANLRAKSRRVYQCLERECLHQFTATTGTLFHKTHLPLNTWFMAIAMICDAKKGMSANQLKRHLGVNYRTAWFLCHRIREAMAEKGSKKLASFGGQVEIDETYVGPKVPRKGWPRTKRTKKDVVIGMVERGGELRFAIVPDAKAAIIRPVIESNVSRFVSEIFTDEHAIYPFALLKKFDGKHKTICHKSNYAIGDTHTNTIENAFSLLKRGLIGTFHKVSIKHLERYLNEFSYRFNRRKMQAEMFAETVATLLRRIQLPYKKLTAEAEVV